MPARHQLLAVTQIPRPGHAVLPNLVCAAGAHIGNELNLTCAALDNPKGNALNLDSAWIDGSAVLYQLTASGEVGPVRAIGAHVGGPLSLTDATLIGTPRDNPHGNALNLDSARIDDSAVLDQLTATGQVRAAGAHIGSQLSLTGAD